MAGGGGGGGEQEEVGVVADLLTKPFSNRTFPEKLAIVRKGRPTPKLASLSQSGKGFIRHFQYSNYERYPWLTASEEHCKLYCWDCLLFATNRLGVWNCGGFANLSCLTKAAGRHQSTAGHLQAVVLARTFGEIPADPQLDERARKEAEIHDEKVRKNREILKRLIDCVVFVGKQELSFGGRDGNRGNYQELLSLLAENNTDLHYHLTTNTAFCGTSGKIQNDLIDAIAEVMEEAIKAEIRDAPFVCVMVHGAAEARNAAQLAVALRYVAHAGVRERFVRFVREPESDVSTVIVRLLQEFQCLDKTVAQCFDGAPVGTQGKVKEKAPMALFVHCYAHRLSLVLSQGAAKIRECKIFFAHLDALAAFFSGSPRRTKLLDDVCKRRLQRATPTRWQNAFRMIGEILEERVHLKELFHHILEHHDEYDAESVRGADDFNARLDDFDFCFLLHTFNGVFEHSDVLFSTLRSKTLDVPFCQQRVSEFCDTIEREKNRFEEIFAATERILPSGSAQGDRRAYYQQLHRDILNNILCQMKDRFQDHEKLMFLSLLDPLQFRTYGRSFPHAAFAGLTQSHGALFDLCRLKTELTVLYAMVDFKGKSPVDLLDFLRKKNLTDTMGQLYTLACLALTMPVAPASVDRTFSALERIRAYSRNTSGQLRPSAVASMAIEKGLLLELKRTDNLHNRVIEAFLRKEMKMDFVFRQSCSVQVNENNIQATQQKRCKSLSFVKNKRRCPSRILPALTNGGDNDDDQHPGDINRSPALQDPPLPLEVLLVHPKTEPEEQEISMVQVKVEEFEMETPFAPPDNTLQVSQGVVKQEALSENISSGNVEVKCELLKEEEMTQGLNGMDETFNGQIEQDILSQHKGMEA